MNGRRSVPIVVGILVASVAPPSWAQGLEVAPVGGYRFGNALFETAAGGPIDTDGAPALGFVIGVPISGEMQLEVLFSHQDALVEVFTRPVGGVRRLTVLVDHYQAGGLREFGGPGVRPFLTGLVGLTRYAAGGDSEIRFTAGAGGGAKVFPRSRIGVRLDARVFVTLLDAEATGVACSSGTCLFALRVQSAWQAEFTAGVVVRLGSGR